MPTYDYVCSVCAHTFEAFQKMSDPVLESCPQCEGLVKRKIGAGAGLVFKGSGFYITDYKNGNSSSKNAKKETKTKTDNSKK